MNNQIVSSSDMIMGAYKMADSKEMELPNVWKKVVRNIHSNKYESEDSEKRIPIGERLAGNTRVVDYKNGVLLVETDHSGWIQYLRMYQKFILKGLQINLPDLKIKNLAFRQTGTTVQLSDSYENQLKKNQLEMNNKIEEQEKKLNEIYGKNENKKSSELPPEILEKFESIKKSMLTN